MPGAAERCEVHGHTTRWRTSVFDKKSGQTVQVGPVHESPCPGCTSARKARKRPKVVES